MTILTVHNAYQQPGGEDVVFRQEASLLAEHGHEVIRFQASNEELRGKNYIQLVTNTIFSSDSYKRIRALIQKHRPLLMHVHNTFPLLSPAVYYAAADELVPVVQTLHNYRLLCPVGLLFRDGHICESCVTKSSLLPAIAHGCYRESRSATAVASAMLMVHRGLQTYERMISAYIVLSEFGRSKFVEAGLPAPKIFVKPNFVDPDPGVGRGDGRYGLFVGRLSREKGLATLLDTWKNHNPPIELRIAGDGPMASLVREAAARCPRIQWLGHVEKNGLVPLLQNATFTVVPSLWYEPFGLVVIESFAAGTPVLASNLGSLSTLVDHNRTGRHFAAGDPADLARQITWLCEHPAAVAQMRREARLDFESKFSGEQNYRILMNIYRSALSSYGISMKALDSGFPGAGVARQEFAPARIAHAQIATQSNSRPDSFRSLAPGVSPSFPGASASWEGSALAGPDPGIDPSCYERSLDV